MAALSDVLPARPPGDRGPRDEGDDVPTVRVLEPIPTPPAAAVEPLNKLRLAKPYLPQVPGYDVLEVLGRGGMGIVYKARQQGLHRLVALKLILAGDDADREEVTRFFHEAEAIGALRHPNIVQVYEAGEHDGRPFLSLEYVDGGTLQQRIQDRPQAPAFAAETCETVARAVHAVHALRIVHRDLKPANILLHEPPPDSRPRPRSGSNPTPVPVAKITDFGLAKRLDVTHHLTRTGTVAGTPAYMAPEQARADGGPVGPAADVWAVGVILYEMLTGRPPFQAPCPIQTLSAVMSETPVSPHRLVRGIPGDLETICLKCLEKAPARRYATALDLAEDLRRFREGRPILARRAGTAEQAWRWCARNPVVAGLLAGILAVFAAGAGVATLYAVRADENAHQAAEQRERAEANAREAGANAAAADAARLDEARQKEHANELTRQATDREARGARERYALDANLARVAWEAGDVVRLRQFLDRYRPPAAGEPDLRGFEWYYLDRLNRAEAQAFNLGGDGRACGLTFVWGGDGIAYGQESDVCVYAPGRMAKPVAYKGHTAGVLALATDPRTGDLATASLDGTVRVWDPRTGKVLRTLRGDARQLFDVAYTPDGRTLIACGGESYGEMKPGEVRLWDSETGRPKHTLREHRSTVAGIAVSGDGKLLMSCGFDGMVHCHDVETGKRLRGWTMPRPHTTIALHPGKTWFAVGSPGGSIAVCDAESGALLRELHGHTDVVDALACSPDGSALASGSYDGSVRVWNPETGQLVRHFRGHVGIVNAVAFRPNSGRLASLGNDPVARVWDVRQDPEYTVLATGVDTASMMLTREPAGLFHVGNSGEMGFRDASTGRPIPRQLPAGPGNFMWEAVLLPDGDTLALLVGDGTIGYRSLRGGKPPAALAKATKGTALAAAPNGRWVAVLRDYRWVDVYDLAHPGGPRAVTLQLTAKALAFGPGDEPVLAVVYETQNKIDLFRPDGTPVGTVAAPSAQTFSRAAFSPDGTTLATADNRSRVHLWDVRSQKVVWCAEAHTAEVRSIAFSPRGDRIVTASADRTAKVLDVATGRETLSLRGHGPGVVQALFTPDGASIITAGYDGRILRWTGSQPR